MAVASKTAGAKISKIPVVGLFNDHASTQPLTPKSITIDLR